MDELVFKYVFSEEIPAQEFVAYEFHLPNGVGAAYDGPIGIIGITLDQ